MAGIKSNPLFPKGLSPENVARFWAQVDRTKGPDACWPWMGTTSPTGYGSFRAGGHNYSAHRLALFLHCGIDHAPKLTCHSCDNPRCCNGAHLFPGTNNENHLDMVRKRRHQFGERNGNAVLKNSQVDEIRAIWARGGVNQYAIADQFGVCQALISMIVNRKNWKLT